MKKTCIIFGLIFSLGCGALLAGCETNSGRDDETHAHSMIETEIKKPATCTENGESVWSCQSCPYTETRVIPKLGHDFDSAFTVDRQPTENSEGQKSRHCKREGCTAVTEETVLPRLSKENENTPNPEQPEESKQPQQPEEPKQPEQPQPQEPEEPKQPEQPQPQEPEEPEQPQPQEPEEPEQPKPDQTILYTIRLVAGEGCDFKITDKTQILIYRDSSVFKVLSAAEEVTIKLEPGSYIVRADNLGDAYLQENYCVMTSEEPTVVISIGNNPNYDAEINRYVDIGDTMFNFLVKDSTKDSGYQRLYDLMEGKKLVYLDFFFVACNPCESMLESQLRIYNNLDQSVKDKFLMIMVDTSNDTRDNINHHRQRKNIPDEILTMYSGGKVYRNVVNTGYVPYGLYLDSTGKVLKSTRGSDFESMIKQYITNESAGIVSAKSARENDLDLPKQCSPKEIFIGERKRK